MFCQVLSIKNLISAYSCISLKIIDNNLAQDWNSEQLIYVYLVMLILLLQNIKCRKIKNDRLSSSKTFLTFKYSLIKIKGCESIKSST